jgi:O-antigen ligase
MFSGQDATFKMRVALWQGGWEIFKDYPLTGCGFRCVDLVNSQYPDPTGFIGKFRGMHNNFIQLAVDTGVLGLTAWLGIWFCFFRLLCHKATALKRNIFERWAIFGSSAAVLAFLAAGLFETNFYDSEVAMLLYFIMALPFSRNQKNLKAFHRKV